jgi:uncharacterized protein (UPF0335 family)
MAFAAVCQQRTHAVQFVAGTRVASRSLGQAVRFAVPRAMQLASDRPTDDHRGRRHTLGPSPCRLGISSQLWPGVRKVESAPAMQAPQVRNKAEEALEAMDSGEEREKRYHQIRSERGRELLAQYPAGIPDASATGDDLFTRLWASWGWRYDLEESLALGLPKQTATLETKQGRKEIPKDFAGVSEDDMRALAHHAYGQATYLWGLAKEEADKIAAEKHREAELILKQQSELREFIDRINRLSTMAELDSEQHKVRDVVQTEVGMGLGFAQKKLIAVQSRMINLERSREREARRLGWAGVWIGVAGFVVGLLFGGFSVYAWVYPWDTSTPAPQVQHPNQNERPPGTPGK